MKQLLKTGMMLTMVVGVWGLGSEIPTSAIAQMLLVQAESSNKAEGLTIEERLDSNSYTREDGSYSHIYAFEGKAGETLTIDLISDEFDAYLMLFDPDKNKIGENDNWGEGYNSKIVFTVPKTGTYLIFVISKQPGESGNYFLSWREATEREIALAEALDEAERFTQLAIQLYQQGEYDKAITLAEKALAIHKKISRVGYANNLNNLAGFYQSQGRYKKVESLYLESLAIVRQQNPKNYVYIATILNNLALLYKSQGRYTEAESRYLESLAIIKKKLGDNHPHTAGIFNNLANFYKSQGNLYKSQGNLYKSQEKYSEAETFYLQALAINEGPLGLGHNHPYTAGIFNNLAELYWSMDKISGAIDYLTKGLEVQEYNLSKNLNIGDEKQKRDYIRTFSGTTSLVISLNLQSAPNKPKATRLALKTILQRKGRILDVLTNSLQILRERTDDSTSRDLLTQLIQIRTRQSNLAFTPPDKFSSPEVYRQKLADVETESKKLEDKISRRSAEFRNLSQPITLEGIQQQIPANSALVEIVRYRPFNAKDDSFGNSRYAVYILFPNGDIKAKDLGEAAPIEASLTTFREDLRSYDNDLGTTPLEQVQESARELDAKLMQPIRELLEDTKTILLSPDAALNLIPFEALFTENNQYLVEDYQITYLTSGRDLLRLKDKFPSEQPPLIIANPTYTKEGKPIALNPNPKLSVELSQYIRDAVFLPVPGTQEQADELKKLLPQAIVLTKSEATENALKQVKRPDILHVATHGFFRETPETDNNDESPQIFAHPLLRSGLVFAGVKVSNSAGDDGVLTALETTSLNLVGTQLVVLSACETGVGDITIGEGVYGLRRALVIAGSESQLFSLWKVPDKETKNLMVDYYQRLQAGKGRTEALRRIQLEMINSNGEYSHPYYWASFIPSGEIKPMSFKFSQNPNRIKRLTGFQD